jgi:Family of unknown function (DUF6065)
MKLICYRLSDDPPAIVPAPLERDWMEATGGFAYRCLPLNIANAHGWLILNDAPFIAQWSGGNGLDAVTVQQTQADGVRLMAASHFGYGVLTFHIDCLFRTEPGYDLWVTGPTNMIKDGIAPLSAAVETDWSPFTFTMNWRFTRKSTVVAFEHREPICMIFPVQRALLESVEPEIRSVSDDKRTEEAYLAWADSRTGFNKDLTVKDSAAQHQKWQKDYVRGIAPGSGKAPPDHRTKVQLKPFK